MRDGDAWLLVSVCKLKNNLPFVPMVFPFVPILQYFQVSHGRLTSNPISDTHNNGPQNMLNAELKTLIREEIQHDL